MSYLSIPSGGTAPKLQSRAAEPTARPRIEATPAPAVQRPETRGTPRQSARQTVADNPANEALAPLHEDDLRRLVSAVHEALSAAGDPPLQVGFRPDERNNGFVIEVRTEDGDLVRQFPPELILNLRRKLDELSGMVVDRAV